MANQELAASSLVSAAAHNLMSSTNGNLDEMIVAAGLWRTCLSVCPEELNLLLIFYCYRALRPKPAKEPEIIHFLCLGVSVAFWASRASGQS